MTVKATAVAHPAATKLLCTEQTIARPNIATLYGKQILGRQRAVVRKSLQQTTIEWTMVNEAGQPLDLSDCGSIAASSSVSSSDSNSTTPEIQLRIREALTACLDETTGMWLIPGQIEEASTGRVTATYDVTQGPALPGIYWAEFGLLNRDGEVIFSNTFRLYLERSLFGSRPMNGPPTIADIRLHMRDSDPVEGMLIDNVEFSDEEIIAAIERPIMYWNETPPPIDNTHTTQTFPHRFHWMEAIVGLLMQTAVFHYNRNSMQYQAGGMAVNDLDRAQQYMAMGQERWNNFKEFCMHKKAEINISRCWGSKGSIYGQWG